MITARKKRYRVFIAGLLATVLMAVPVFADTSQTFTTDGTASVPVMAVIPASYEVYIPASLSLAYDNVSNKYEGQYNVGAKGRISSKEAVYIYPDSEFEMYDTNATSGVSATASVTQSKYLWTTLSENTFTNTGGTVSVTLPDDPAIYSGNCCFTFGTDFYTTEASVIGAEILNIINRYTGRSDFYVVVGDIEYIGNGTVVFDIPTQNALIAAATDPSNANYIDPDGTYLVNEKEVNSVTGRIEKVVFIHN